MAETSGNNRVQGWSPAGTLLVVAVAYYLGAQLGFILRFPPTTPSVLWPPNSILTATLLLTPVRRGWVHPPCAVLAGAASPQALLPPAPRLAPSSAYFAPAVRAPAGAPGVIDAAPPL